MINDFGMFDAIDRSTLSREQKDALYAACLWWREVTPERDATISPKWEDYDRAFASVIVHLAEGYFGA